MSVSIREALVARREALVSRFRKPAAPAAGEPSVTDEPPAAGPRRRIASYLLTTGAALFILAALILPNNLARFERLGTYFRLPIEGVVAIGVLLLIPGRKGKRIVAGVLGAGLGLLVLEKALDMGFYKFLARPFDPVLDWVLLDDAESFLDEAAGKLAVVGALIGIVLLVVLVLGLSTLAAMRLAGVIDRHRRITLASSVSGIALWTVCLMVGVTTFTNIPLAARSSYTYAIDRARMVKHGINDEKNFAREVKVDAFATTPADQLLTSLRGKDVMVTFVESYGRSAIEDPVLNTGVVKVLDNGSAELAGAGFVAQSGWLTSPTFGGGSWLAHSTLLSGLWINNQQRYRNLTSSDRLTLTSLFKKASWDTTSVMPGATRAWPEGNFYGYNQVYDSRTMGYAGPKFGWGPQADQYTLDWFQKNVMAPATTPQFVEMPLVSSHTPWAPIPSFIDWKDVGDGSVYHQIKASAKKSGTIWKDPAKIKHEYGRSVQYTLTTLISYLENFGDENTVMVFLGDHQPSPIVVGDGASHDVPITIVAKDKAVLDKVAGWGWTDGLKPAPDTPVWPMNDFRDKFLTAFGPAGGAGQALTSPR
ncbi:sulfatase-like hydrolase/transferase [Actinoplanes sp. NPDC051494]|uniref:sulfatase-like hydrolase/transferase n=1 Tax=Actinoplanes sp. NPDC051494 TaxID=3363907 RepID=UPI003791AB49